MKTRSRSSRAIVGALLLALAALAGTVAEAAFRGTLTHESNQLSSGSVAISDNDGGSAMLSLSGAALGATDTSCIRATSNGSLPSGVRHYASTSGALSPYLSLKVTRGSGASSFDSCTGFSADSTDYIGAGSGVIFDGKLSAYPTSYGAGIVDPSSSGDVPPYSTTVQATTGLVNYWRLGETLDTLSSDSFTDVAGTPLENHTGGLGAIWSAYAGEARTAVITDEGRMRKETGNGAAMYYASAAPSSADYTVTADVHVKSLLSTDAIGVAGRIDTSSAPGTYYLARYVRDSSRWEILRVVDGAVGSLIGTSTQLLSSGSTYRVELDMSGTTIRLLVDGLERISGTDAAITAAGRAGVRMGTGASTAQVSDTAGLHLDDFSVTTAATTATDSKGTNDGAYNNGVTLGAAGALSGDSDGAAQFDGVDDYVRVARTIQDDFSIEFWFKSTQGLGTNSQWWGNAGLVDAEVAGSGSDFGTSLRSDGRIVAGTGAPDVSIVSSSSGFNDGNWHHVTFTRTRSTGAMQLYVDGTLQGSATGTTISLTGPANIDFGRIQAATDYFQGTIDEVALHSTALSGSDVASHYEARVASETWTTSESHDYRFQVTLDNDLAALGLSASATFRWEAQNR